MKALIVLTSLLIGLIVYLALSCGNPVDYSKMKVNREVVIDQTFTGFITGSVEITDGTYLVAIEYSYSGSGKPVFSITSETIRLYSGMDKLTSWIAFKSGKHDYRIESPDEIHVKRIVIYSN